MQFGKYLREYKKSIGAGAVFCAVFALVFWLYRLPVQAVLYPALLCALLGICFLLSNFRRAREKHEALCRLCGLQADMIDVLPPITGTQDADYQAIIRSLQAEVRALETDSAGKYQDMVEYYTVWAHQIKTPIASMYLHLQNEDRQLRADLKRIEQYVEMVLAFLRLDSENTDYVFREQPLDPIIKQAVKRFSAEFIGRRIGLEYGQTELRIVTDEKWLQFVLEQILSNALKYTREGCVRIYMQEPATLCIADTGIGIAPEDLPRIFEKGYTGYNGRTDKKASGIGLYLCRRVCDGLGIGITASSEVGKGTTVKLSLAQYQLRRE